MATLRPVTLITGASAGIGVELARVFARHGHELALVARREDRLRTLAGQLARLGPRPPIVIAADLAAPGAVRKIADELRANDAEPNFIVNNAGFGLVGLAGTRDRDETLAMIDVNVRTLTELSVAFVDSLARHKGGLLNVGSVAGFLPGPGMAVYYATKAYVLSFSEALHSELRARGIRVTVLCPGPVPTEFAERAGVVGGLAPGLLTQSAEQVAEAGFRGLMAGKTVVLPGLGNKLVTLALRIAPRRLVLKAVASRQRARRSAQGIRHSCSNLGTSNFANRGKAASTRYRAMHQPVLIVLHQEHSQPGRVGQVLTRLGYPLDIRRPRFGDPLPATMDEHAGAVIFGGPQSANDEEEFVKREIDWIGVPLRDQKPFLGICLGGQMMARHLGARVYPHPQGHAEVGYYPIRPTEAGRSICAEWPDHVYQWHREGFDLPAGSELLAEGEAFSIQAFRSGTGYALQFHPEVTHAMMYRWLVRGAHRMELPGTKQRHEHIADRAVHDYASRNWLAAFIDHWIGKSRPYPPAKPLPKRVFPDA